MAAAAQTAAVKKGNAERKKNAEKNKNWVAPDEGEGDEHSSFTPPIVDSVVPYVYPTTGFWKHQEACRNFYTDNRVVVFVAGLIVFNFFVSMTEKQIDPGPKPLMYRWTWFSFGLFFNICFTIELGINMCVLLFLRASREGWRAEGKSGRGRARGLRGDRVVSLRHPIACSNRASIARPTRAEGATAMVGT